MPDTTFATESYPYGTVVAMTTIICYKCSIPFAIPERTQQRYLNTGDFFYCPEGHRQHYTKSKIDELTEKLAAQEAAFKKKNNDLWDIINSKNQKLDAVTRQKSAIKGQLTRVKNRIKNGVCPCCNRTFANLHKHMESQHPDYNSNAI